MEIERGIKIARQFEGNPTVIPNVDPEHITKFRLNLDTAKTLDEVHSGPNTFLWAIDASDDTANADIRLNNHSNSPFPIKKGMVLDGLNILKIFQSNTAQSGKWIDLILINSPTGKSINIQNAAETFSTINISEPATLVSPAAISVPATTQSLLSASDSTKKETIIQNLDGANTILIGNSTVSAANGYYLFPGASLFLNGSFAVYGYNSNGVALSVSVTEIKA